MADSGAKTGNNWWQDHFSGLIVDLWKNVIPKNQAINDADFILSRGAFQPGAKLLDVPCGEGRVAIELASRGFDLIGVDISGDLLAIAQSRSAAKGLEINWHHADMHDLEWEGIFDGAFCWGDSFGYMDDEQNMDFLRIAHRTLKPGGHWMMEMKMVSEILLPHLKTKFRGKVKDIDINVSRVYDPEEARLFVEYNLKKGLKKETRRASYRIYSCDELIGMLEGVGFKVQGLYDRDNNKFENDPSLLRIVCEKP